MAKPASKEPELTQQEQDVSFFVKNVWFFLFYFMCLLMIASFGLIAEA